MRRKCYFYFTFWILRSLSPVTSTITIIIIFGIIEAHRSVNNQNNQNKKLNQKSPRYENRYKTERKLVSSLAWCWSPVNKMSVVLLILLIWQKIYKINTCLQFNKLPNYLPNSFFFFNDIIDDQRSINNTYKFLLLFLSIKYSKSTIIVYILLLFLSLILLTQKPIINY